MIPPLLAVFMWSFFGAGGEWDYYLATTPAELERECGSTIGGCATPYNEIWVLEEHRYLKSNYPCLTVEDHEFAHALGWWHGDMASACMWQQVQQYQMMYPTNNVEHLRQMALR